MPAQVAATSGTLRLAGPLDHLEAELCLLDLAIVHAVTALRRSAPPDGDGRHLYVSHDEVDRLLDPGSPAGAAVVETAEARVAGLRAEIDAAAARAAGRGVDLPLTRLTARLGLGRFETQTLVTCLAPELDRKYDRLYAYLQDDITRKRPSVDLAIKLHTRSTRDGWTALSAFAPRSPLLRYGVLRVLDDPYSPSGSTALSRFLQVTPRFVAHLLGDERPDPALAGPASRVVPRRGPADGDPGGAIEQRLAGALGRPARDGASAAIVHVSGGHGTGRSDLAHAVAARLETGLVEVDAAIAAKRSDPGELFEAALREGWLTRTPVLLTDAGRALGAIAEGGGSGFLDPFLDRYPCLLFLTGEQPWRGPGITGRFPVHEVVLPSHWYASRGRRTGRGPSAPARGRAPRHHWDDLVLDEDRLERLREICDQVRHRERVFGDWGFERAAPTGGGLSVLFSGPSGTGKTMAAGVIADRLGLDLYRIDLSQVVSKYIGETEKNLARVFAEAEHTGSVLLFDEADALFGKRTQIGDAHDRYANIETSYLLQRMEDYAGIAIMASNLRQNMDEAFLRRLHFVVEFPFPDAASRLRIWRRHLPEAAPLGDDLDLEALAERVPVAGGGIRNIALAAAFLAAAEDRPIGMAHLLRAARREYEKTGKLWQDVPVGRRPSRAKQGARR